MKDASVAEAKGFVNRSHDMRPVLEVVGKIPDE